MTGGVPREKLRVLVPADLILDGQVEFPQVGDRAEYALTFVELRPGILPEMRNDITAQVKVLAGGRVSQGWTDPAGQSHPGTYSMLLHGRGWAASLHSTTLYQGTVQLAGSLSADFPALVPEQARTRGTVTDRQLVTHTSRPGPNGRYPHNGVYTLGPVREDQRGFADGLVPATPIPEGSSGWVSVIPPPEGPWIQEVGVLVDLHILVPGDAASTVPGEL